MGWLFALGAARAEEVTEGSLAPDFELPDQRGQVQRLTDYRGRWVVLYFYPKNDTPGCTKEACSFRDGYLELKGMGAEVLGVSLDDAASHAEFAAKYRLPFPLLADRDGTVARRYGVLWKLGPLKFAKRQTFIIDPQGQVVRHYAAVDAEGHGPEVIKDLRGLGAAPTP